MRAVAIGTLVGLALLLAACGGGSSEEASCGPRPTALTPAGTGPDAFTMGIRVNQIPDVKAMKGALGDYILDRDLFVLNTEYPGTSPKRQELVIESLTREFPCNRVATLNGLAANPDKPSYAFALADHHDVDAILVDWEKTSYADAAKGRWSPSLETNIPRIATNLRALGERLKNEDIVVGLAPQYLPDWNYGRLHRTVALANLKRKRDHLGYQVVQTQANCGRPSAGGPPIGPLARRLIGQYRAQIGQRIGEGTPLSSDLLQHLGFEIAFDEHPKADTSEPVERIGSKQAAVCSAEILKAGGTGILYWATPQAVREMLKTPEGRKLRPPSSS